VEYLLRFVLIASFAVGLPTCLLAFVALKRRRYLERLFLALLVCFLALMLCEALIYYLQAIPGAGRGWIFILFAACRALVALLAILLWLLAAELVGLKRSSVFRLAASAAVILAAAGAAAYGILSLVASGVWLQRLRQFQPADMVTYAVFLCPVILVFARFRHIRDRRLARAALWFAVTGAVMIPAAIVEDYFFSRPAGSDLVVVLPLWFLTFNALLLFFGLKHWLRREHWEAGGVDPQSLGLTAREREIVGLVLEGYSNRTIGEKLFISPATVRNHLHNIFEKTGASRRVELARLRAADSGAPGAGPA
jgi:DNA-binding CsgD family transcriptional regulator